MDDIKKMLGKKKDLDPMKKEAKLSALKGLRNEMSDMMKDGIAGKLNKVTVAAPDKKSLEMGLDKAKDLLGAKPEDELEEMEETSGEDMDHDMEEGEQHAEAPEHMSEEEIDEMMSKLAEMKKKLALNK